MMLFTPNPSAEDSSFQLTLFSDCPHTQTLLTFQP